MPAVQFGRDFFRKIRNDYASMPWAVARELGQNAADCGATRMEVTSSGPFVSVENDGPVMSQEILEGKLLTMGETTKEGSGSTGGFGIAKGIIYLCHRSYEIATGDLRIKGSGGAYDYVESSGYFDGTKNTIEFESAAEAATVVTAFKRWAALSQWDGEIVVDGEKCDLRTKKGYHRCTKSFGRIYTNNSWEGLVVVRKDGQPMHTFGHGYKKCVIVELEGDSASILTGNRDGLRYPFNNELADFLQDLAINKKSALRDADKPTQIDIYRGPLVTVAKEEAETPAELTAAEWSPESGHIGEEVPEGEKGVEGKEQDEVQEVSREERRERNRELAHASAKAAAGHEEDSVRVSVIGDEVMPKRHSVNLFVRNSTGMKIPECYLPGPKMSEYTSKLLHYYTSAVRTTLKVLGMPCSFSVGLTFTDEPTEASYGGKDPNFGHVFYIAPVAIVAKGGTRAMKKQYKLDAAGRWLIIANAVHEVTHIHYKGHDENYAAALTNNMAIALARRGEFSKDWR